MPDQTSRSIQPRETAGPAATEESTGIPWGGVAMALLLCVFWGGVAPSIKIAVAGVPPMAVAVFRFLIAIAGLWLWCRLKSINWTIPPRALLPLLGFALVFVGQIAAVNHGTRLGRASFIVVMVNTSPLFVTLMAHWLLHQDRISGRKVLGLLLAFSGIGIILLRTFPDADLLAGNLLGLISGFLLAVLHVYSKFLVRTLTPVQIVFWEFALSLPIFVVWSLATEPLAYNLTLPIILSLLYQGLVVAAFCFVAWLHLMKRYAASQLVSFQFSIPVFGVLISHFLLGEPISPALLIGAPLVIMGIYLVSQKRRPQDPA